jgi:hypothetical protein
MKLKKLRISLLLKSEGNIASSIPKHLVAGANLAAAGFYIRGTESKRLALGAQVGAAVLHRDPLDDAAANGAGFAPPQRT